MTEKNEETISHEVFVNWRNSLCTQTLIDILNDRIEKIRLITQTGFESLGKIDMDRLNQNRGALVEIKKLFPIFEKRDLLNDFLSKEEDDKSV